MLTGTGFLSAAKLFEVEQEVAPGVPFEMDFYPLLDKNKQAFDAGHLRGRTGDLGEKEAGTAPTRSSGSLNPVKSENLRDSPTKMSCIFKRSFGSWKKAACPKQTAKTVLKSLDQELKKGVNPLKVLAVLRLHIAPEFFRETMAETAAQTAGPTRGHFVRILLPPLKIDAS